MRTKLDGSNGGAVAAVRGPLAENGILIYRLLPGVVGLLAIALAAGLRGAPAAAEAAEDRAWSAGLPRATAPQLTKHGLVAEEIRRWRARGANQGVAVDDRYFYGIGNFVVGKYDKRTGARVGEWVGLNGGPIIHLNGGLVQGGQLVLAHSNFPQLPMASSVEYFDCETVRPVRSVSLGVRHGSLTWAERKDGCWWACFAQYSEKGGTPGRDNRWTVFGKFDDRWQMLESWIFPPQVVAAWGMSSSSGGSWGEDGLLYVSGHDAKELYVLRLPQLGVALEYVTTIDVPFEGSRGLGIVGRSVRCMASRVRRGPSWWRRSRRCRRNCAGDESRVLRNRNVGGLRSVVRAVFYLPMVGTQPDISEKRRRPRGSLPGRNVSSKPPPGRTRKIAGARRSSASLVSPCSASTWAGAPLACDFPMMQTCPFLGGPTDLLVLLVLRRTRRHGWGITQRLRQLSQDVVQLDQAAVSSSLRRLQGLGWVEAEVKAKEAAESSPVPVYRLTRLGRQRCRQLQGDYERMATAIVRLMERV